MNEELDLICPTCKRKFYGSIEGQYCPECWRDWVHDKKECGCDKRINLADLEEPPPGGNK